MISHEEAEMRARYGAWRYWRWVARLRGFWLWARVRYHGWHGTGGIVHVGPGLYIWPFQKRVIRDVRLCREDTE